MYTKRAGTNTTDRKFIKRYVEAGWTVDEIAMKVDVEKAKIQDYVDFLSGEGKYDTSALNEALETDAPEPDTVKAVPGAQPPQVPSKGFADSPAPGQVLTDSVA